MNYRKELNFLLIIMMLVMGTFGTFTSTFAAVADEPTGESIIIGHDQIKLDQIPEVWINQAKNDLHIVYEHTSHGSQITTGMTGLVGFKGSLFAWNSGGRNGALDLRDTPSGAGDLGNSKWPEVTRTYLNTHPDTNVVMWSWCGQVSSASESYINTYLNNMNTLENEYPNVKFVYMTGHLDGTGVNGNLNIRNEQIRNYCEANNKILYDFADIESYNPDGVYFLDKRANDACAYDTDGNGSRDGNWAIEWQDTHVKGVDWYEPTSAHSEPLNANMKAYGAWWLWARLAGWDGQTDPQPVEATINLNDVDGNPLADGLVVYNNGGENQFIGKTDVNGTLKYTFDSSVTNVHIMVQYQDQMMEKIQNIKALPNFDFVYEPAVQDTPVDVNVHDEAGLAVAGVDVDYYDGTDWRPLGLTGQDGKAQRDFDGTLTDLAIRVQYGDYTEEKTQNIQENGTFNFIYKPVVQDMTVEVVVRDEAGLPVAGATIDYFDGSSWLQMGRTGLDGKDTYDFDGSLSDLQIRVQYGAYVESKTQNIQQNSVYEFVYIPVVQDIEVTVNLNDVDGNPLANGYVVYNSGGDNQFIGKTNSEGKVTHLFDGTTTHIHVMVEYLGQMMELTQNIQENPVFSFIYEPAVQDTAVDVNVHDEAGLAVAGVDVDYYDGTEWRPLGITGQDGKAQRDFDGTITDLAIRVQYEEYTEEKTQNIQENGSFVFTYVVEEPETAVDVYLKTEFGEGIPNAVVSYYEDKQWKPFGTTDNTGKASRNFAVDVEVLKVRVQYEDLDEYTTQYIHYVPVYQFVYKTSVGDGVTIKFIDSQGNPIEGGHVKYAKYSWTDLGLTDANGEIHTSIEPGTYKFRMNYGVGEQDLKMPVVEGSVVTFRTIDVTTRLESSNGAGLSDGKVKYARYSWEDIGVTDGNGDVHKELLPGTYKFRMDYGVTQQDISQNIAENSTVLFKTIDVKVRLESSDGSGLAEGKVKYARYSWEDIGVTDGKGEVHKELLPGTYKFRMDYGVTQQDIKQNIEVDSTVLFKTIDVKVRLESSDGNGLEDGKVKFSRYSWEEMGVTDGNGDVHKELLPGQYKFRMNYGVGQEDITQDITEESTVLFKTIPVVVQLKDGSDEGINGATIKYARYSWDAFGVTGNNGRVEKELLAGTYKFRAQYESYKEDQSQNIGSNETILFIAESINPEIEKRVVEEPKVEEPKVEEPLEESEVA